MLLRADRRSRRADTSPPFSVAQGTTDARDITELRDANLRAETAGADEEELDIFASDGPRLAATLIAPPRAQVRGVLVVAPAMAVSRRYYLPFLRAMASAGIAGVVADYRGFGGSRRGRPPRRREPATLVDWARRDLPAVASYMANRFDDAPLLYVGHSLGGQLLALADGVTPRAALFVGSQSGYWRNWEGAARAAMWTLAHVAIPTVVPLLGKLPMGALGQGEDVPPRAALQWARWIRAPSYLVEDARAVGATNLDRLRTAIRSYAISDDGYAPPPSVAALLEVYATPNKELRTLAPSDVGAREIGHFGFFRRTFEDTLWREAREWLVAHLDA
jgi:predicted alpha/beta hydrolase